MSRVEQPPAGLYDYSDTITTGIDGFDAITEAHIEQFNALGFMVIHNAFDTETIAAGKAGLRDLILNPDFKGIDFEAAVSDRLDELSDEEKLHSVRKFMAFVDYDARLKAIADDPGLLRTMERLIGEPPVLMQDMALLKPPRIGREKPWHQDMAYFNLPADTPVVGAWIALDEAVPENGCMMVIPGTHQDGPVLHWDRRDWQICDTDVQVGRSLAVPLPPGGCLMFHCLLHHGTPPSQSHKTRWAVQYHYKPAGVTAYDDSTHRLEVFGEEGKDATC